MKKKIKLITTFASLGLALALMVFGVYAATTATYKITSTVSFTAANDIYLSLDKTKSKIQKAPELDGVAAVWTAHTGSPADDWVTYTGTGTTLTPKATVTDGTWAIGNLPFTSPAGETAAVYSYQITLTFNVDKAMPAGASAVNMTISGNTVADTNVAVTTEYKLGTGALTTYAAATDVKDVAKDQDIVVVFTLRLKDPAVSINAEKDDFNPSIAFAAVAEA